MPWVTRTMGIWGLSCLLALALPDLALAGPEETAQLCDRAAARAARDSGVPLDVLRAITRTETGRSGLPWPWTVNLEGLGQWFETRQDALDHVEAAHARGARRFDVGCFQINYRWHGAAFRSLDEMFDPDRNGAYAAQFLAQLYAETGDWARAAGAYHSRTPEFAERYAARFEGIRLGQSEAELPRARAVFGPPRAIALAAQLPHGPLIELQPLMSGPAIRGSLMPPDDMVANLPEPLVRID